MSFDNSLTRLSSSESVASPLRKKSILAQANTKEATETILNDDDAERRERRRKSVAPDPARTPAASVDAANRRKSLGLGACSGLSAAQLSEHYASCIKLSTENKITVKNAFSLQLIDYMSMMLKRHDKQMEDFQVASCTLDASTKIYSFRVDAVHSDVVQMATSIGRAETNKRRKAGDEEGDAHDDGADMDNGEEGPAESQVLKKLKKKSRKHKSSLAEKPESLRRKQQVFQTMNPFLVRLSANLAVSQSGECPFHHSLKCREPEDAGEESQGNRGEVPFIDIPEIKSDLCPSFRDFKFLGWRPENDPRPAQDVPSRPPPAPLADLDDDHAFDMNQTPEPIPEMDDFGGGGGFDGMDSDHEEMYAAPEAASRAAAKIARQPAHVVDLKQHLSTVPLEYSYFQQSMISLWAGPAHWKVKPLRKDKDKDVAVNKEAKKRTKKEMMLNFENTAELQKYFGSGMKKLNKKTIQGWSSERVTAPYNIHYDPNRITRLFLRESISVKVSDDSPAPEVDDEVGGYQYDNPTDQVSFCPNVPPDDDDDGDHGADAGDGMMHDDDEDMFQNTDVHTEVEAQEQEIGAFTGDNLIAPPNKVAKVYIPYQMRAKKMDMKKLKGAMWSILTKDPEDDLEEISQKVDDRRMEGTINFKSLYGALSQKLPSKMSENLSCPLAFVGLLHLANEKCLDIRGVEDMGDLIIGQN
ncbi:hypothetical protein ONE63_009771 [Megalurothrips usitatus]|uniref:Condensin complex subunit 2 n=1 Tax=Megalurothrips usitatus TaxID=439358 RepID=A0AAV7XJH5_9NEOP|nr:hypothetical protein ONE63_009771 [Megalurothrips usitatus]